MSAAGAVNHLTDMELDQPVRQHHSHAFDRRGAAGQIRTPRHADGSRAAGLHDLESRTALRS